MFNLFKREKEDISFTPTKKQYMDDVERIHDEFNSCGEAILEEALQIISKAETEDVDKGIRLKNLGFRSTPQAIEAAEIIRKKNEAVLTSSLVREYAFKYPNNKFITESHVQKICEKYNLVCGEASRFKGFVPAKNLKAIEDFSLHTSEANKFVCVDENNEILDIDESDFTENGRRYVIVQGNSFYVTGGNAQSPYTDPILSNSCLEKFIGKTFLKAKAIRQKDTALKICAPIKDMDTSGLRVSGHKLQHIPDPVVLKPVIGGYLIVTAWGDEASDESVVNQDHN